MNLMRYSLVLLWFFVIIASFSYFNMPGMAMDTLSGWEPVVDSQSEKMGPPPTVEPPGHRKVQKTIGCYEQQFITGYMKKAGYRIIFNWMSDDGKLIKLLAATKKAGVILIHILDSKEACVIDEFGKGTVAPIMFFELFDLVRDPMKRNKKKAY